MADKRFIQTGNTYIENDSDGLATGSLFKCIGIEDFEYVMQCLEFDCDDVEKRFSIYCDDSFFKEHYTLNEAVS